MKTQIVFLADAGSGVGWGHVYRLLPVWAELKKRDGVHCVFAVPASCPATHVADDMMEAFPEESRDLSAWFGEKSPAVIVVDSYRHHELLQSLGDDSGFPFRVVQFDDHYRPIGHCSTIVNAGPTASMQRYRELGCSNANLLLGPRYISLSQDFRIVSGELPPLAGEIGKILVALGGSDTEANLDQLLVSLAPVLPPRAEVAVVGDADVSTHDPRMRSMGWLDQHSLAALMLESDLAIFAGGGMLLQAMAFGLPVISWPQTDNQLKHARAWEASGGVMVLENLDGLAAAIASLQHIECRQSLRANGRMMVDGEGARRIASHLCALLEQEASC